MTRTAALLAAGALAIQPAAAQDTDAMMMRNIVDNVGPEDAAAGRFLGEFGKCAAADQLSRARDTMRRLPASDRSDTNLYWIAMLSNGCVSQQQRLRYSVRYLRGPVAEYLLKRDFDLSDWSPKDGRVKVYAAPSNSGLDRESPETRSAVIFNEVGACVVSAAPAATATLLQTDRDSEAEKAAFAALNPTLAGCLPPKVELRMSKFELRGYLAEAAYRHAATIQTSKAAG